MLLDDEALFAAGDKENRARRHAHIPSQQSPLRLPLQLANHLANMLARQASQMAI